uniref:Solute carrier family 4 member 1 (Diego blood group) n=1 Tax=Anolis carolinensis TaxID=28377 RepID=A0A803TIE7_ANOCA
MSALYTYTEVLLISVHFVHQVSTHQHLCVVCISFSHSSWSDQRGSYNLSKRRRMERVPPGKAGHYQRRENSGPSGSSAGEEPGSAKATKRPYTVHRASHEAYVELHELIMDRNNECRWLEASHWIKIEEDFEELGHWGRPHLSYLTFQSLMEVRRAFTKGTVLLDLPERSLAGIANQVLDQMIYEGQLKPEDREMVLRTLLLQHSHPDASTSLSNVSPARLQRSETKDVTQPLLAEHQQIEMKSFLPDPEQGEPSSTAFKKPLSEKISPDAEATLVLVGCATFLERPTLAFVRLKDAVELDSVLEVPVPVRFLFVVLGPDSPHTSYHEIGRAISTMMSERVFRNDSYLAEGRTDLVKSMETFLDCCIVLPPSDIQSEKLLKTLLPVQKELLRKRYQPMEKKVSPETELLGDLGMAQCVKHKKVCLLASTLQNMEGSHTELLSGDSRVEKCLKVISHSPEALLSHSKHMGIREARVVVSVPLKHSHKHWEMQFSSPVKHARYVQIPSQHSMKENNWGETRKGYKWENKMSISQTVEHGCFAWFCFYFCRRQLSKISKRVNKHGLGSSYEK